MCSIVINMEHPKKFWEQFPIEVILDEIARKLKHENQREQLQIPIPPPYEIEKEKKIENEDIIIIKFS